ncbi:MAG: bifunctional (p)ppGpp synthetase/guanosine-3',5'-bis(diphosphate) 3'-pyrophosphohydrolase, partial [Acidobacteriota bacterium]
KVKSYNPSSDEKLLQRAYLYSAFAHEGQLRYSGEPYLVHPVAVAALLAELRADDTAIVAGLLHDVIEDNHGVPLSAIQNHFGDEVAHIVDAVTKIEEKVPSAGGAPEESPQWATLRKLILAMVDDIRVILVKLADRLHNMRTLDALPKDRRPEKARETLEIYAPIAYRLGLGKLKNELEELSFRYAMPAEYASVSQALQEKRTYSEDFLEDTRSNLLKVLKDLKIKGEVQSRIKHLYSIYKKLERQGINVEEVYDYMAFRILVNSVRDCYAVLGGIHSMWKPIPGRFKDYIAIPKENHYRSLHTSVIASNGQPIEVQIRTWQMHAEAENGLAAHWRYKEGRLTKEDEDSTMAWLRQVMELRQSSNSAGEFVQNLRIDLYPNEVYVFTPKGKVMSFPRGATPLDFAYAIHTEVGQQCIGAKINNKLVPLKTPLTSGDMVEIMTSPSGKPSRDWLKYAVTGRALNKIKAWLNAQEKKRAVEIGKSLLDRECKRLKINLKDAQESGAAADVLKKVSVSDMDALMAEIGYGKLSARTVARRFLSGEDSPPPPAQETGMRAEGAPVVVRGATDFLTTLAKCCKPIRGDDIVGFISRGKGLVVHRTDCPNMKRLTYNPDRVIPVTWELSSDSNSIHEVPIVLRTEDRPGMVAAITHVVTESKARIRHIDGTVSSSGEGRVKLTLGIRDRSHLNQILSQIAHLDGVLEVFRKSR